MGITETKAKVAALSVCFRVNEEEEQIMPEPAQEPVSEALFIVGNKIPAEA